MFIFNNLDALKNAASPADVEAIAQQIIQDVSRRWEKLSPSEKKHNYKMIIDYLFEIEKISKDKLGRILSGRIAFLNKLKGDLLAASRACRHLL